MSLNINRVTLAGHLTRDPELRQISADRAVVNTGLAINRRWRNAAGEQQEEATFVDLEAWGRTAEIMAQYLRKGSPVYIEGRLKLDAWEDPQGQKRSRIKVSVESLQMIGGRPGGSEGDHEAADGQAPAADGARTAPSSPPRRAQRGRPSAAPLAAAEAPF